jgi:hypothetical protein
MDGYSPEQVNDTGADHLNPWFRKKHAGLLHAKQFLLFQQVTRNKRQKAKPLVGKKISKTGKTMLTCGNGSYTPKHRKKTIVLTPYLQCQSAPPTRPGVMC